MSEPVAHRLYASRALLPEGWASDVAIGIDRRGMITEVLTGTPPQAAAVAVKGPLVPAMPNLHSHAFQRAMAGLAEVAGDGDDSFWTWRDLMYRTVAELTPEDVAAIATKLYVELLKGGFGAVAEFHYLHNSPGGPAYAERGVMSRAIAAAAADAGIGLALLPVFYAHANFGGVAPSSGQRRFINDVDGFLSLLESVAPNASSGEATLGVAFHSLRAATPEEMRTVLAAAKVSGPIHIHIAEQAKEVEDCLAWSGRRPVEWLLEHFQVGPDWCLVHATHMEPNEVLGLAHSGAVAGLCPATEANLGDGIFAAVHYLGLAGRFGIGTDSHVAVGVAEELRTLEYGQRLRDQRRNRLVGGPGRSAGRTIFDQALAGGAQALGQPIGAIAVGKTASFVVLDGQEPMIGAAEGDQILDRWLFALGDRAVRDVMVKGQWRINEHRHENDAKIDAAFRGVLSKLSGTNFQKLTA